MTKKNLDVRVKKSSIALFLDIVCSRLGENIRVIRFAQNPEGKRSVRRIIIMSNKKPKLRVVGSNKKHTGTRKKSATSKNTGLTDKQEAFALAVFEGNNFSEAYRLAYDASNMSAACIHTEACLLVQNPKVSQRLEVLNADRVKQQRMLSLSRSDFVLKQLTDEATNQDNSDGARVRALELLGKSVALFTDKVETEDKTERDPDTIKAELEARLNRLLG